MQKKTMTIKGQLNVWDVDEWLWPEGLWMPVCKLCMGGPLSKGEVYCGDFNGIAPGKCIEVLDR